MVTTNSTQAALRVAGTRLDGTINGGEIRRFRYDIVLASQGATDTINLGKKPRNHRFMRGYLVSDTSLGTAAPSIGVAGNVAKHRAAAVHTTVDQPVIFGKYAAVVEGEIEEEDLILTNTTAAFPASGNLSVEIVTSFL